MEEEKRLTGGKREQKGFLRAVKRSLRTQGFERDICSSASGIGGWNRRLEGEEDTFLLRRGTV